MAFREQEGHFFVHCKILGGGKFPQCPPVPTSLSFIMAIRSSTYLSLMFIHLLIPRSTHIFLASISIVYLTYVLNPSGCVWCNTSASLLVMQGFESCTCHSKRPLVRKATRSHLIKISFTMETSLMFLLITGSRAMCRYTLSIYWS